MIPLRRPRTARLAFLTGIIALGIAAPAYAQGTAAPAGTEPATAPGGTEGLAGPRNEAEAIRDEEAIRVPRGEGIPVERVPDAPPPPTPRP